MLRPTSIQKSPRMVPGAEAKGLVSPSLDDIHQYNNSPHEGKSATYIFLPVLTASLPVQTIPTTGPEDMYSIKEGKKPLPLRSQY